MEKQYVGSNELQHYGVLGMKWGVRRARKLSNSARDTRNKAKQLGTDAKYYNSIGKKHKATRLSNKSKEINAKANELQRKSSDITKKLQNTTKNKALYERVLSKEKLQQPYKNVAKNKVKRGLSITTGLLATFAAVSVTAAAVGVYKGLNDIPYSLDVIGS